MADEPCGGCGKPMGYGEYTEALGKEYHIECFKCFLCNKELEDGKFCEYENKPVHGDCADEADAKKAGGSGSESKKEADEFCAGCQKKIVPGVECFRLTNSEGTKEVYHDRCLMCSDCGKPIGGAKYGLCHGRPVHADTCMHHAKLTKEVPKEFEEGCKCDRCGEDIKGQRKVVPGFGTYHLSCFKCSKCNLGIRTEQTFFKDESNGQPICHRCN